MTAHDAAVKIVADIRGRKGLGDELDQIDKDIVKEMISDFENIISDAVEDGIRAAEARTAETGGIR